MTDTVEPALLECLDVSKSFGPSRVLAGVSLSLPAGSVTALAGENGAGKSTLMKIVSGQYRADEGTVRVRGEVIPPGNARAAVRAGIAIVPQELASILDMTVYENMFVGREVRTRFGFLNRREMARLAQGWLDDFGLEVSSTQMMRSLSVGVRQIVEIIKATSRGARVLLLDEPTSAIAEKEVARLASTVRSLRDKGVAVLFTTHKMEEIRDLADRVVILRDGAFIRQSSISQISDDEIIAAMIGRNLSTLFPEIHEPTMKPALEVEGLVGDFSPEPFALTVHQGEIVGLAGLVGAGRTEIIESIFGVRSVRTGTVAVNSQLVRPRSPSDAIAKHMAFVPEDRKSAGAVLSMSVLDNVTLPHLPLFSKAGWLQGKSRRATVQRITSSVGLRSSGPSQLVENLSGGNQQKVVFSRWLTAQVDVLLLDEPTRGVDIGARSEIYQIIVDLAQQGMAVVMASSDMPEILGLAHRAIVIKDGKAAGELSRAELTQPDAQDKIFRLASGLQDSAHKGQTK